MANNQKGFANIILVVIVVVIAGAVGYFVVVKKSWPVVQQTPTPKDETANWETYTNTEYGLEFKYPSNLNVLETNSTISLESHYNSELYINVVSSTLAVESEKVKKEIASFASAKLISDKNITIDGYPAIKIVAYYPESGVRQNIYYFSEIKGKVFIVTATPLETKLLIDQIVSTFKFTK